MFGPLALGQGYTFLWAWQGSHICHKLLASVEKRATGWHNARVLWVSFPGNGGDLASVSGPKRLKWRSV